MEKLLVILGPTATGKTDLGLNLAKKFDGELVAADSRQVYKGLDIGTGKLPTSTAVTKKKDRYWEIDGIKIWMYDVVNLTKQYTVADYIKEARVIIDDILDRGKLPIVVGGTGFYAKALLEGIANLTIPVNEALREELEKLSLGKLQERLKFISPDRWKSLNDSDKKNPRRLLRSIELVSTNPYVLNETKEARPINLEVLKIGLTASRNELYKKSDLRVLTWFKKGIIEEVWGLHESGIPLERFKRLGLEYGLIADFIDEKIEARALVKKIQDNIHGYIRRQQTWFNKVSDIFWFDITKKDFPETVEKQVSKWYHSADA